MKNFYLGIDVGGTNIKAGTIDNENNIILDKYNSLSNENKKHFNSYLNYLSDTKK